MAVNIQPIIAFLKRTYPLPRVDPTWVKECCDALVGAGKEPSIDNVHSEYIFSDLSISTLESSTFPQGELHNMIMFPQPTLLQIHAISEVGASAFQVQTVMEQRSEVLSGHTRIRGLDDDQEEQQVEEGKVPPYPRSMLRLEVGDGRRLIRAMEYKRLGDLVLGQTSLGTKMVVHKVEVLRDILLLTPENTQVIVDSCVDDLEALQRDLFVRDLKKRLGKLDPDGDAGDDRPPPFIPPPIRGGKRGKSKRQPARRDTQHAIPPTPKPAIARQTARPATAVPRNGTALASATIELSKDIPKAQEFTPDEDPFDDFDGDFDESFMREVQNLESKAVGAKIVTPAVVHTSTITTNVPAPVDVDYDSGDEDFMILDESMVRQLDMVGARGQLPSSGKGVASMISSSKVVAKRAATKAQHPNLDDEMDANEVESFVRPVNAAEASALANPSTQMSSSGNGGKRKKESDGWRKTFSTDISSDEEAGPTKTRRKQVEIIEISD